MLPKDAGAFVSLWIAGERKTAGTGETFSVINPRTRKVVSTCASACSEDCIAAITAASSSLDAWEKTSMSVKRDIFLRAASLVESDTYRNKILAANVSETASSLIWSALNLMEAASLLRQAAACTEKLNDETLPSPASPATITIQKRAIGVVLAIAAWNAPTSLAVRAICAPLVCGNTVVFKTSECSPGSQAVLAEIFQEAGLPPGVLNIISVSQANSAQLTGEIIAHPLVRKINFTGGDEVGKIIAVEAASRLKPCVLELGGKCPALVLDDADIDTAALAIVWGGMLNSGQVCMSTERVIVQHSIAPALISALTGITERLKAADPSEDPSAQLTCLYSEASAQKVISFLEEAKSLGADFLVGDGTRVGSLVQPHLVTGVKPGMKLWERESFGPVLAIMEVDTVDDAVEMANSTEYSLVASVWTSDQRKGMAIAERIRAGSVLINGATIHGDSGFRLSGLTGTSGYGTCDIDDWIQKRLIIHDTQEQQYPFSL